MAWFTGGIYGARLSGAFTKNNNTLANVTGVQLNLEGGRIYRVRVYAQGTCSAADGVQFALAGTATTTQCRFGLKIYNCIAGTLATATRQTGLGGGIGIAVAGMTEYLFELEGVITVNAAGNIRLQFANSGGGGGNSGIDNNGCYMESVQMT